MLVKNKPRVPVKIEPWLILKIILKLLCYLGSFLVVLLLLLLLSSIGIHLGIIQDDAFAFSTFSIYISPLWYGILLYLGCLPLIVCGRFTLLKVVTLIWGFYFIAFGDHSIWISHSGIYQPPQTTKSQFKVAAVNIRYYSYGLETVVKGIKQLDADVVLLSEHQLDPDQMKKLTRLIHPMKLYHGKAESTAILSRLPVLHYKQVDLPSRQASLHKRNHITRMSNKPFRSFSHAVIDVRGTPVDMISIRLIAGRAKDNSFEETWKWSKYLLEQQKKEIDFFFEYLKQLKNPVIFGGDLNTPPSSLISKQFKYIAIDTFLTHNLWGNLTFKGIGPFAFVRLDYLFSKGNIISLDARVERLNISDHWPIVATYTLP